MADNTTLNVGVAGDVIATDDIGGVKYQRVKVNFGPDNSTSDVSLTNPLPILPTPLDTAPATQNITAQDASSSTAAVANGQNFITGSPTANSAASFSLASGFDTVRILVTGTWTGTLSVEMSMDGGTTWTQQGLHQTGTAYTASTFTANFTGQGNAAGFTNVRVRETAAHTGTATVAIVQSVNTASVYIGNALKLQDSVTNSVQNTIKAATTAATTTDTSLVVQVSPNQTGIPTVPTPPTLTKGTQGSTGFSTQDIKDAGRSAIVFYATNVTAGASNTETAITLTRSVGNSATATSTSYTVTSGKRLRLQNITVAARGHATATAQVTTFNLRMNTGGAVTTTSTPVLISARVATPATALSWDRAQFPIPDGYEILGDGTLQIGLTAVATFTTNAPTWDATIVGYEY